MTALSPQAYGQPMTADPAHLTWRPVAPGDAAACAVLFNAIEDEDHFGEYYSEADAAEQLGDPGLDLERGTLAGFDGEAMVGYSWAMHRPLAVGLHRVMLQGGVHPAYRRRGIGARLLAAGIASAKDLHAIHHPDLQLTIDVQTTETNPGATAAYRAAGMSPIRWYSHMTHPLGEAIVDAPIPEGFVVEGYSAENDAEFHAVRNEAFLDHWGAVQMPAEQWRGTVVGWQSFRPDLSFLLRDTAANTADTATGTAAGILVTHFWEADTEATGIRDAHYLLIGTRRAYRKRGVAGALIAHAQRAAEAAGFDQTSLQVDSASPTGAAGLYEKAGYTVARTDVRFTLEA